MRTSFKLVFLLFLTAVLAVHSGLALRTELAGFRLYQATLSPVFAKTGVIHCRFQPTCSAYADRVLRANGFYKGNVEIARRLAACSPAGYLYEKITTKAQRTQRIFVFFVPLW
ncbi:MAG TPA: membrane protein insertion efficiency factor YidD [Acidobacteriota bacterium]|jgi:putative membrane protein insertion efficiency factor